MSENLGSTQPNIVQPKSGRRRSLLLGALGLILILALAVVGGYQSGISIRKDTQSSTQLKQLGEQFQLALVDMEFKRYANAEERLQFIIETDPTFPGAQEKLTEVLVLRNVPTPTLTPSLTPTPDFSGAEQAFSKAQQLIAAQDWPNALAAIDQMRKLDRTYQQSQVDGMYYFVLRNYGYDQITKQGNLEGGIYHLALAERFGPLDRDANGLREGARFYILGASFWELDWAQAVFYFDQVYRGWSGLWDGTMTATDRYYYASMRYGDQLVNEGKYCDAVTQYQNAQAVAALDKSANQGFAQAYAACYPATDTPAPAAPTATVGGPAASPTDTQPVAPTDTPPPPTDTLTPTP